MSVYDILKELNNGNGTFLNPFDKKKKTTFMDYEPGSVPKKETWSTPEYKKQATVTDDFLEGFNFYDDESSLQIETPIAKSIIATPISKSGSVFKGNSRTTAETLKPVNAIKRDMTPPKVVKLPYYFGDEKKITNLPFRPGNNLTGAKYPQPDEFIEGLNYYDDERDGFKLFSYNADASEKGQELYPALYTQTQSSEPEKNYITDDMDINPKCGKTVTKAIEDAEKGIAAVTDILANPLGAMMDYVENVGKEKIMGDLSNAGLWLYDVLDEYNKIPGISIAKSANAMKNRIENENVDLSEYYKKDKNGNISYDYITNQSRGAVAELKYGSRTMSENGCGAIAVYNSLITLGMPKDIRNVALDFEGEDQMLGGIFGTKPEAIKQYFEKHNCDVSVLESSDIINKETPDADTYILVYWNNANNIMDGAHFVSIEKDSNGKLTAFNSGFGKEFANSIKDYITNGFYKEPRVPVVMYCITRS